MPRRGCVGTTRSSSPRTPWYSWTSGAWVSPGTRPRPWRCSRLWRVESTRCVPGVTVRRGAKICTAAQHTDVYFRPATERELRAYIRTGEPMDKAGAYGVQGKGALLVERIDGDFFNVMGLPVGLLARLLKGFGIDLME